MKNNVIVITGAREHNLRSVNLSIPKEKLVVITGPSGSGKSSLALDTIFAEGQRRYIESLSSYARQFLGMSKKPAVDKIEGLCPAIAIEQKTVGFNPRSTVGTITEIYDYLRVLFARVGIPHCPNCKVPIKEASPESITKSLLESFKEKTISVAAPIAIQRKGEFNKEIHEWFQNGLHRFIIDGRSYRFKNEKEIATLKLHKQTKHTIFACIDKIHVTKEEEQRLGEAIERSFALTNFMCAIIDEAENIHLYSSLRICLTCTSSCPELEPRLFSFNSPLGACSECHGLGVSFSQNYYNLIDENKSKKDKFLDNTCSACQGARLKPEALAVIIHGKNIYDICCMAISNVQGFLESIDFNEDEELIAAPLKIEILKRIGFLMNVGLSYLTLSRNARTLSGGEGQRIRLATQIGSALSGVIYILDEPSIGLHQRDNDRLIHTLKMLRDQGNTVLVVEHDIDTIKSADYVIDMGPAAGILGGEVTAVGTPRELKKNKNSLTGKYLSGEEKIITPKTRRVSEKQLRIIDVETNNLQKVTVTIPLGIFVAISGVSGSGKSSLIVQTLAPALKQYFYKGYFGTRTFEDLEGLENILNVVMVDQSPIGRTPRSNPATYLGIFDDIRSLFASLPESKARGYQVGRFSFNVAQGRCFECNGEGIIKIAMHFLEDVTMTCKTCRGMRYNKATLEIEFKGKNISNILNLSVHEALKLFEHFTPIQKRLKLLCDVGLDYIKLGQPSTTLSGGEAQRIKLVNELSKRGKNTLYILDEPTTGLHSNDVKKLLLVLNKLVDNGNSVLVIEHNLDILKSADHIIDIGPDGGDKGGLIVAEGTPEQVAQSKKSITAKYLKKYL
ncbi:excinuclease ABC subunit A [Candidatus Dependentiae bacterium]|nr:MAG: excinuclease ABC subunit A [Candidatus Dependentiae bacterium]